MTLNIRELANSLESNSVFKDMLKLQSLTSASPWHMYLKQMEQQEAAWRRAMQPLSTFESEAVRFQSSATEAMKAYQKGISSSFLMGDAFKAIQSSLSIADQFTKSAAHFQVPLAIRLQTEQMEQARKTIFGSINSMSSLMGNSMMAWSTEMDKVREQYSAQNDFISRAMKATSFNLDQSIADQFRIPVIDQTAATLLAGVWGKSGITRQLDALGIDFERLCREIEQRELIDHALEPSLDEERSQIRRATEWLGQPHVNGVLALLGLLLGIYQILLIYLPTLSPQDSEQQQQARFDKLEKHLIKQFQPILEQIISKTAEQAPQPEFVVKERVASVRRSPKNGSMVIAEIFPNQGVTMLNENGKWIEIEYYDWLHQEFRNGWALKKYFVRVQVGTKSTKRPGKPSCRTLEERTAESPQTAAYLEAIAAFRGSGKKGATKALLADRKADRQREK